VPAGRLLALAREALAAAEATGAQILINDRPDVARILGAEGVHVGRTISRRATCALLPPPAIVGLSTHALEEVEASKTQPIDYVAIDPSSRRLARRTRTRWWAWRWYGGRRSLTSRPLVAIGGITRQNARLVIEAERTASPSSPISCRPLASKRQ
jgi:thiamine-phosphate pyrophosphorylase